MQRLLFHTIVPAGLILARSVPLVKAAKKSWAATGHEIMVFVGACGGENMERYS